MDGTFKLTLESPLMVSSPKRPGSFDSTVSQSISLLLVKSSHYSHLSTTGSYLVFAPLKRGSEEEEEEEARRKKRRRRRRRRRRRTFKYNASHHVHDSLQPCLKNENENPDPYIPHTFHPFLEAFAKCA